MTPRCRRAVGLALLPLAFGLAYLAVEAYLLSGELGFPLDDAWIHLQFARGLAAGEGLTYNPGEPVTGSTAPLWTAVLALLLALPGNVVLWTKLVGLGLTAAGVLATDALARTLGLSLGFATFAAFLVAATDMLVWSGLSGMEVPLFVLIQMVALRLHVLERRDPRRPPLALPVVAVGALVRPEALLLLALAVVDGGVRWQRENDALRLRLAARHLAWGLAGAAVVLLPVALAQLAIGDSPLPTTVGAKTGGVLRLVPAGRYLLTVFGILLHPQPVAFLLAGAGALVLVERLGTRRDAGLLLALWPLALPLAYALLTPHGKHLLVGNFGRYYFPLFPPLVVLGVLGLERAASHLGAFVRAGGLRLPLRAALAGIAAVPTLLVTVQGSARYAQSVANVADSDVAVAAWMRDHVDRRAVVAVQDIGAIKFLAPQRVVDLSGIVTPEIRDEVNAAISPADPFGQQGMLRFLVARRPDYLVAYPDWYPALTADPRLLRPVRRFEIPGNITMAGDQLVVYATPWTRYPPRTPTVSPAPRAPEAP